MVLLLLLKAAAPLPGQMKVRNARAALLSDYELLLNMQELERKRVQAAAKNAKLNDTTSDLVAGEETYTDENMENEKELACITIPSNLRNIQYPLLETLSNVQRPCAHQNEKHIASFLDAITAWERGRDVAGLIQRRSMEPISKERKLTKGEKLMLVNHAPADQAALYPVSLK